jgi:hypothetical protein
MKRLNSLANLILERGASMINVSANNQTKKDDSMNQ